MLQEPSVLEATASANAVVSHGVISSRKIAKKSNLPADKQNLNSACQKYFLIMRYLWHVGIFKSTPFEW